MAWCGLPSHHLNPDPDHSMQKSCLSEHVAGHQLDTTSAHKAYHWLEPEACRVGPSGFLALGEDVAKSGPGLFFIAGKESNP
jgi:hypothetical protein